MAKEIKPSRDPRGRVIRSWLPLIMINDMHRLSAASPGSPVCEWSLVAYMILHANITSEIAGSAGEREKGHVHTLSGPGRVLPSRSASAVGVKMFR